MPERMLTYNIDKIFWGILSVLLVSPMLYWYDSFGVMNTNSTVVYPITTILVRSFPFSLVYSALGSVAVVAIAWERIANARNTRMDALIKRAWDKRTREAVDRVGDAVSNHRSVDSAIIAEFLSVWKKSGKIFHIDQLCPKAALNDLEQLVPIALKYDKAWSDFEERIRRSGVPGTKEYVLGLKDLLDRGDGVYYAWVEPGHSGDLPSSFTSIGRRDRDRLVALKSDLEKSDYLIKDREGFWKKELSERASRIRDAFRDLVAERGLAD
jgi:hypothetical protein